MGIISHLRPCGCRRMTTLAGLRSYEMRWRFSNSRRPRAAVARNTGAGRLRVIEPHRGSPGIRCMAGIAGVGCCKVRR